MTKHYLTPNNALIRKLPRLLAATLAGMLIQATVAQAEPKTTDTIEEAAAPSLGVVNINTATAEELMRLPGVGPAKAEAILAMRAKLKSFPRIAALMRVRGIGRKTFVKLKPMLTIEGPTTLVEKGKTKRRSAEVQKDLQPKG